MTQPTLPLEQPTRRTPQPWRCDLCTFTYTSPLPLAHPPNHRCAPAGRIPRIRKMIVADEPKAPRAQRQPAATAGTAANGGNAVTG